MDDTAILAVLKICIIFFFFGIVLFVGTLPLRSASFQTNKTFKSLGTTLAGALFINVAIIHILPESSEAIQTHLQEGDPNKKVFPVANLLMMGGYLLTLFFTRILSIHTHDQKEEEANDQNQGHSLMEQIKQNADSLYYSQNNRSAYFLTLAMYFHTIFECIAIGVQNSIGNFLSITLAISFHKWADALSMGIHYRKNNVPMKVAYGLIIGQAVLNVAGIGLGWVIDNFGQFVQAIFLAVSAGTFLAISTMEMLNEQFGNRQMIIAKFLIMLFATGFISMVWFVENAIF